MRTCIVLGLLMMSSAWASERDFATERPDRAITPKTPEKGRLWGETELVSFKEDKSEDKRTLSLFEKTLRYGATSNLEFQLEIQLYQKEVLDPDGLGREEKDGLGDSVVRIKQNLMGNDEGKFALAVMPIVYLPTASAGLSPSERVNGGLALPASYDLGNDWTLEGTYQVDNKIDQDGLKWETNQRAALSLAFPLIEQLVGYVETFNIFRKNPHVNETYLDLALQYELTSDIKIDAGTFQGLNKDATDEEYFVGTSVRY